MVEMTTRRQSLFHLYALFISKVLPNIFLSKNGRATGLTDQVQTTLVFGQAHSDLLSFPPRVQLLKVIRLSFELTDQQCWSDQPKKSVSRLVAIDIVWFHGPCLTTCSSGISPSGSLTLWPVNLESMTRCTQIKCESYHPLHLFILRATLEITLPAKRD